MTDYKMKTPEKIENAVVGSYKSIENGVVSGYKKIENAVVSGYKKVEENFVDSFLMEDEQNEKPAESQAGEVENEKDAE